MIFHLVGELLLMYKKWFMEIREMTVGQVLHLLEIQLQVKRNFMVNI